MPAVDGVELTCPAAWDEEDVAEDSTVIGIPMRMAGLFLQRRTKKEEEDGVTEAEEAVSMEEEDRVEEDDLTLPSLLLRQPFTTKDDEKMIEVWKIAIISRPNVFVIPRRHLEAKGKFLATTTTLLAEEHLENFNIVASAVVLRSVA